MQSNNTRAISSWRAFARQVRAEQEKLLVALDEYPNSILVTGCQRSGGTMLARVITNSNGMARYPFSKDDELDAALILAGRHSPKIKGRYCFQTTYLNERYHEYFEHPAHHIIWSLRNPYSVVYSMVYNWRRFALNELFLQCGYTQMDYRDRIRFQRFGMFGISPLKRAAYAYNGKVSQLFSLKTGYPEDNITVVEYDILVKDKMRMLPALYQRVGLAYAPDYAAPISERSLNKRKRLNDTEKLKVKQICEPVYQNALALVDLR